MSGVLLEQPCLNMSGMLLVGAVSDPLRRCNLWTSVLVLTGSLSGFRVLDDPAGNVIRGISKRLVLF